MNRLCTIIPLFLILTLSSMYAISSEAGYETDPIVMDAWMQKSAEEGKKDLVGRFLLDRFKDRFYFLLAEIGWEAPKNSESQNSELVDVIVPKGFVTDFASIPPIFYSVLLPDGDYAYAAVIHDYLYWQQDTTRGDADLIFWLAMEDLEINRIKAAIIYGAVRVGGWLAWDSNEKAKTKGEKRIMKRFPQDPTETWLDWKIKPGVF